MVLSLVPLMLVLVGAGIPLIGGGFSSWGFALVWIAAMAALIVGPVLLRLDRPTRVFFDIVALVGTLVVFAPEGGWWFVPAVVARLALDIHSVNRERAVDQVTFGDAE